MVAYSRVATGEGERGGILNTSFLTPVECEKTEKTKQLRYMHCCYGKSGRRNLGRDIKWKNKFR